MTQEKVRGLVEQLSAELRRKGYTLSAAESCTGGKFSAAMTDLSGASDVFIGGAVTYTNDVKQRLLHVDSMLLEDYGAVSEDVAEAMALGVKQATGSSLGVGITGLAGPNGDGSNVVVGTVYISVSCGAYCDVHRYTYQGDRAAVREKAVVGALESVLSFLGLMETGYFEF